MDTNNTTTFNIHTQGRIIPTTLSHSSCTSTSWAALSKHVIENILMEKHSTLLLQILASIWPMQRLTHYSLRYSDNYSTVLNIHRTLYNLHGYNLPPNAFGSIIANVHLQPRGEAVVPLVIQPHEPLIRNSEHLPTSMDMNLILLLDSPTNTPHSFVINKTTVIKIVEHEQYPGHVDTFDIIPADGTNNYLPRSARSFGIVLGPYNPIVVNARPDRVVVQALADEDGDDDDSDDDSGEEDSSEDEDELEVASAIDVGTKVMKLRDKTGDCVTGEIVSTDIEEETGAATYHVTYCDGVEEDLDSEEVEEAILLYEQRRGGKEKDVDVDDEEVGNSDGADGQVDEQQCKLDSDSDDNGDIGSDDHHQEEDSSVSNSDDSNSVEDDKKEPATKKRKSADSSTAKRKRPPEELCLGARHLKAPSVAKRKRPSEELGPRRLNSSTGRSINRDCETEVGGVGDTLEEEEEKEVVERRAIYHEYQVHKQCGMHALNAILQGSEADKQLMMKWSEALYQEFKKMVYGERRRFRNEFADRSGNYSYEVVAKVAMKEFGVKLVTVTEDDKDDLLSGKGARAYIIHEKDHVSGPHFYSIVLITGSYWMIDSLDDWPRKIEVDDVIVYIESHLSKEEYVTTKAVFSVIPEDCPDMYDFSSDPYSLDDEGIGQWWSPEFLEDLAGDKSSLEVDMSPRGNENNGFSAKTFSMEVNCTLHECVEEFFAQNGQTLNDGSWRLDLMTLHIGEKVLEYARWTHIPVKVIGSKKVELEIVGRLRSRRR